ncbi:nucleotide exchange factor GrpE [Myroides odoratus]|uniref:nucleotide exchange factor GrpE n=1 Tax=Myroides odoratus TaxID=256 RepID=UPI0039AE9676
MENKDINKEEIDLNVEDTQETETAQVENESMEEILKAQVAEEKDKYLRLFAEFENYKRRTSKERLDLFKTANEEVVSAMLPVLDDFSRALLELEKQGESDHLLGFQLIATKLIDTLAAKGLKEVAIQSGDVFNADLSEAITQIPAGDELKGKVVDVVEKGYKLGDKIIRFPKVVIGQ